MILQKFKKGYIRRTAAGKYEYTVNGTAQGKAYDSVDALVKGEDGSKTTKKEETTSGTEGAKTEAPAKTSK